MTARIDNVEAGGDHAYDAASAGQRALIRGRVDADREPAHDRDARLGAVAERFCTFLDCASVGGINLDQPSLRAHPAARSVAPSRFTVADLAGKVHPMTGQTDADYSIRQAPTT